MDGYTSCCLNEITEAPSMNKNLFSKVTCVALKKSSISIVLLSKRKSWCDHTTLYMCYSSVALESRGKTDLHRGQTCQPIKHLIYCEMKNMKKEAYNCWTASIVHQARLGKHFAFKTTRNLLSSQIITVFVKETVTQHGGKHSWLPILFWMLDASKSETVYWK